jgi:hypothetical protein
MKFASLFRIFFTTVYAHYMKFAYKFVDIFVWFATSLLTFEPSLCFLFAYTLVRFVQKFAGDIEGLLSCLRISSNVWSQICFSYLDFQ